MLLSWKAAMTETQFDTFMEMDKKDLILLIWKLSDEVKELREHNTEMGWRLNPDRMGGQFTEDEKNWDGWQ
jgi:hypothetical protein